MKCLRRICRIRWEDRVRNKELRARTGQVVTILERVQDIKELRSGSERIERAMLNVDLDLE